MPNGRYAIPAPQVLTSSTVGYSSLSSPAIFNEKQFIGDGDVILNSKQSLSFKSLYSRDPESLPFQASTNVLGFGENDYHSNLNLALSYTHVINSSTANQLRIGYSRNYVDQVPVNPFTATSLGMTPPTSLNGTPSFLISGLFELGTNRNNNQLIRQHEVRSAIPSANPWDVINSGLAANQAGLATPSNPIHGQTTSTQENVLERVPFIGFGPGEDSIGMFRDTYCTSVQACLTDPYGGKPFFSRYNSAQFSATKRYSKGLSFTAAYTWSNTTSDIDGYTTRRQQSLGGTVGDYHNPAVGTPSFSRANVFSGSYVYGAILGTVMAAESAAAFRELVDSGQMREMANSVDRVDGYVGSMISAVDYLQAMRVRRPARLALDKLLAGYDALIGPTTATVAPRVDERFSGYGRHYPGAGKTVSLTSPGNVTGVPAITVPNGFGEDNLPTAMQFMGTVWSEKTLLDIAVQYQSRTDWHKRKPPVDQWMKSKG